MVRRQTARERRRVDRQICANVFGLCVESGVSWPWWVALRALPDKRDGHGRPFSGAGCEHAVGNCWFVLAIQCRPWLENLISVAV